MKRLLTKLIGLIWLFLVPQFVSSQCSNLLMIDFNAGTSGNNATAALVKSSILGADPNNFTVNNPNGNSALTFQAAAHHINPNLFTLCYGSTSYTDDVGKPGFYYDNATGGTDQQGMEVHWSGTAGARTVGAWWKTTAADNTPAGSAWNDTLAINNNGSFTNVSLEMTGTKLILRNECCGGTIMTDNFTVKSGKWYFVEAKNTPGGADEVRVYDDALRSVLSDGGQLGISGTDVGGGTVNYFQWGRGGGCCPGEATMSGGQHYDKIFSCWTGTCAWPLLPPVPAPTSSWVGILDPTRAADWSSAGVAGGIPSDSWSRCTTGTGAAIISAYAGSPAAINTAIAGCDSAHYVELGSGLFQLNSEIDLKSGVELRGQGPTSTIIKFSAGGTNCTGYRTGVCFKGNGLSEDSLATQPGGGQAANWTQGYSRGATQIALDSAAGLSAGSWIVLDQPNDVTPQAGYFACDSPSCGLGTSTGRTIATVRSSQQQMVKIASIAGSGPYFVTLATPLYYSNWAIRSKSPGAWWTGAMMSGAGIRNLTLDISGSNVWSITSFFNAVNNWSKNVRSIGTETVRNHYWNTQAAHNTIRDSYLYGTGSGSGTYCFENYEAFDTLITNNITQHCTNDVITGVGAGNVSSYNFGTDFYASVSTLSGTYGGHDSGGGYNLYEGNQGTQMTGDIQHGSTGLITAFRNRYTGWDTNKTALTRPIDFDAFHRNSNVIGNVLGTINYHNNYNFDSATQTGAIDRSIYVTGVVGAGGCGSAPLACDNSVRTTMMRWGNYDTFTATSRFNCAEVPADTSCPATNNLPASFYLASQPPLWGTPWGTPVFPPIGPDVSGTDATGHANTIPAGLCYAHTATDPAYGGGILAFDANACYTTGGTQFTVTASKSGSGSGTLTSTPSGISCGSTCSYAWNSGTSIAIGESSSDTFIGWGGTCGCSGAGTCSFTLSGDCTVTAQFNAVPPALPCLTTTGGQYSTTGAASLRCQ